MELTINKVGRSRVELTLWTDRMCKDMTVWSFVEVHMIGFVWSGECMSGWGMERDETKEDIL